jgi:hypothetical protein
MSAVPFDTLKYAEALKAGGIPDPQAKAQAEALAEALRQGGLATKVDIAELRADLKTGLAELKGELQAMLNRHLLAIMGAMVGLTAIFSAVLVITLRLVVIK